METFQREMGRRGFLKELGIFGIAPFVSRLPKFDLTPNLSVEGEHPYYTQFRTIETARGPIIIEANSTVNYRALIKANDELLNLTSFREDLLPNLARHRFKIAILPERAPLNSIPQFSNFTINTGGYTEWAEGGIVAAVSEGNLLGRLTGNELEDWTTRIGFSIAYHEYGHALVMGGINNEEHTYWITQLYHSLLQQPNFPASWRDIFPHTFTTFIKHGEMFAEFMRGAKQGLGPQIRGKSA